MVLCIKASVNFIYLNYFIYLNFIYTSIYKSKVDLNFFSYLHPRNDTFKFLNEVWRPLNMYLLYILKLIFYCYSLIVEYFSSRKYMFGWEMFLQYLNVREYFKVTFLDNAVYLWKLSIVNWIFIVLVVLISLVVIQIILSRVEK